MGVGGSRREWLRVTESGWEWIGVGRARFIITPNILHLKFEMSGEDT